MVRAKFRCTGKVHNQATSEQDEGYSISLTPVVGGSKENEEFYKWTPGGSVLLSTVNPAAAEKFEEGKEFYVDFTPAD